MFSEREREIIKVLQDGLPLARRPYKILADKLGMSENDLLAIIKKMHEQGLIRRFGASLRHQKLGYASNAMVVWEAPKDKLDEAGTIMAGFREVSHCYQRPAVPEWPYSLYTMIHGHTREECLEIAQKLSQASGLNKYRVLFTAAELKKSSMRYFE